MNKKSLINLIALIAFAIASIVITILVLFVDIKFYHVEDKEFELGLYTLNKGIFDAIGEHKFFYYLTQVLGYIAIMVVIAFFVVGIIQLIKGKSIKAVDKEIIGLGIVYIITIIIYVFFEKIVVVNYRPILEDGSLAASFPSSHTLLAAIVFSTSILEFKKLVKNEFLNTYILYIVIGLVSIMVLGRLLSCVHWFSDILASVFYSGLIVSGYYFVMNNLENN